MTTMFRWGVSPKCFNCEHAGIFNVHGSSLCGIDGHEIGLDTICRANGGAAYMERKPMKVQKQMKKRNGKHINPVGQIIAEDQLKPISVLEDYNHLREVNTKMMRANITKRFVVKSISTD